MIRCIGKDSLIGIIAYNCMDRMIKINELILQQLGGIISREVELPDAFVTITRVTTSTDLKYSTVYVSVLPEASASSAVHKLNLLAGRLQKELNKKIILRNIPKLEFRYDNSGVKASEIDQLIDSLKIE